MSKAKKYDKKTPREHVLLRPDTYVGDIEPTEETIWVCIPLKEGKKIEKRKITFVPGFLKIFDEILVNSRDACINDKTCNAIKIEYNVEEGFISVYNNGDDGIPVEEHPDHKMMIPTMIFGHMLTSSNFDDEDNRVTGGRNGYGAKLTNIFSTKFTVEIVDAKRKKKFVQTWTDNMNIAKKASVRNLTAKNIKSYIKLTFYPDLAKFGLDSMDNDHLSLFQQRALEISATTPNVKVHFNNENMTVPNFKKFMEMFYPGETIYHDTSKRWEVGAIYMPDKGNEVISYVNGISTFKGGTHVNHVVDGLIKRLINDYIKKKDKNIKVSTNLIKESMVFFVNAVIVNPSFTSQTKTTLTTKVKSFGSTYKATEVFMKKLAKSGIVNKVIDLAKFKESKSLNKTDGKKTIRIKGIPKLEDANKAGSRYSEKCTLILTEGDSAKACAMSGLSVLGRDFYGVFPLKGKLLNVRESSTKQLNGNAEICALKQIMGLKHGEQYSTQEKFKTLRYGRIMILTDQDVDGSHIKGLLINFIHFMWPSIFWKKDFVTSLSTPIVKAFKGKNTQIFYNLTDYENWKEENNGGKGWKVKYYKGLGTSTSKEAREYFVDVEDKLVSYFWNNAVTGIKSKNDPDQDAMTLAFSKTRANDRKKWLMAYDRNNTIDYNEREIDFKNFVDRELIHFSNDDTSRSIPSLIDGLKPSQRKILYGAFLRNLDKDEVKVAQLAGFVSDRAAYHHGEMSLTGAIIGMAQNYVGSNNINILKPNGQYGTRLRGGKDAASPRYIWTKLEALTSLIFRKSDNLVLNYLDDDGQKIEPENYAPIIPMVLVNGTEGIGTGFSTKIPPYNPVDIVKNLKNLLNDKKMSSMKPWWGKFRGTVKKTDGGYLLRGLYTQTKNKIVITELPVGEWTSNYKEFLDKMLHPEDKNGKKKKSILTGFTDNNTDKKVHFTIDFAPGELDKIDVVKKLKLEKKFNNTNMHLYSVEGPINKYKKVNDIITEFFSYRLEMYQIRKAYQLKILQFERDLIKYKVRFIVKIIKEKIQVSNQSKKEIETQLEKAKFPKLGKTHDDKTKSYNYLINMPIYNLSKEKLEELQKQRDEKLLEFETLEKKTPKQIWEEELDEFMEAYQKWWKEIMEEENEEVVLKVSKKKCKKKKKKTTKIDI